MAVPTLTCAEIRDCEARASASGVSLDTLMQRAGEACAEALHQRYPSGRVVVLAGPGNNGGDAFVAARRLVELGRQVAVRELAPGGARTREGAAASNAWTGPRSPLSDLHLAPGDIVLDGLFGAGLSRPLAGEAARAVERVNAFTAPVVAIDVPSGVSGDSGRVEGPAIKATLTVTFGAKKPAHVLQAAASLCGEVDVAEIGFGSLIGEVGGGRLMENAPDLWSSRLAWPTPSSHKHTRGRLAVVTGGLAHTGAARLAAQAGLRIGAGAVTLMCPSSALIVAASSVTAVMTSAFADTDALVSLTEKSSAVVIGPAAGVTETTRRNVEALIAARRRLVLDADALSVFADDAGALKLSSVEAVLTPHAGEFERLFPGVLAASVNRIEAARTAAARVGAVVLLKGYDTVIAAPDGRAVVNTHATPFLATAGSGDVLAGVIGGLMAQGLQPFDAACAGAWMHGDAGVRAGPGLTAEDLDGALKGAIADLYAGRRGR
ncbi:MAG: NAD(P)H-hydrate dehydratase [Alphaproteobacteria bacterium]|nr:NAD(P)H-hydrate dehydratase [Alphaproteobacteria bacterium]